MQSNRRQNGPLCIAQIHAKWDRTVQHNAKVQTREFWQNCKCCTLMKHAKMRHIWRWQKSLSTFDSRRSIFRMKLGNFSRQQSVWRTVVQRLRCSMLALQSWKTSEPTCYWTRSHRPALCASILYNNKHTYSVIAVGPSTIAHYHNLPTREHTSLPIQVVQKIIIICVQKIGKFAVWNLKLCSTAFWWRREKFEHVCTTTNPSPIESLRKIFF